MCGRLSVAGTKGPIGQQHTQAHPLLRPGRALPQQTYIKRGIRMDNTLKKSCPNCLQGNLGNAQKKGCFFSGKSSLIFIPCLAVVAEMAS